MTMTARTTFSRRQAIIGGSGAGIGLAAFGNNGAATAAAQTSGTPEAGGATRPYLTLETAQTAVDAALSKAEELGVPEIVSVLDDSGVMKAFARQDGSILGSVTIATDKATTAVSFGAPTHELASQ